MRIIYKIKSSWDFISSQILIYLKRRWNSKMAISIKNHEDRITALEKVSSASQSKVVTLWSGSAGNGATITTNQPMRNFDAIVTGCDGFGGCTSMLIPYSVLTNKAWYVANDTPWGKYIQNSSVQYTSDTTLSHSHKYGGGTIRWVIGLKLYYNFSYNITREFYKVKFKLKHYLCSHLQKFI